MNADWVFGRAGSNRIMFAWIFALGSNLSLQIVHHTRVMKVGSTEFGTPIRGIQRIAAQVQYSHLMVNKSFFGQNTLNGRPILENAPAQRRAHRVIGLVLDIMLVQLGRCD